MLLFIVIACIGALLLGVALVFDDVLEGLIPENDWLSLSALATFLVAFGFGAYIVDSRTGLPTAVAVVVGICAGLALAVVALRWSRSLSNMTTDATPAASDLVGCDGHVVTPILPGSTGEVLVRLGGQPMKLTAVTGDHQTDQLDRDTPVAVVRVLSPTRVEVEAAADFWGLSTNERKLS